jgi:hypothetical protein
MTLKALIAQVVVNPTTIRPRRPREEDGKWTYIVILDLLECRLYTTYIEMILRLTVGTLQLQLEH